MRRRLGLKGALLVAVITLGLVGGAGAAWHLLRTSSAPSVVAGDHAGHD